MFCDVCVLQVTAFTDWICVFVCCRFIIGREKPGEQSEVAQLIQQTLEQERWQREMMEQRYKQYTDDDEEVVACSAQPPRCADLLFCPDELFFFSPCRRGNTRPMKSRR